MALTRVLVGKELSARWRGLVFLALLAAIWIGPQLPVLLPCVFAARFVALVAALVIVARSERGGGVYAEDGGIVEGSAA